MNLLKFHQKCPLKNQCKKMLLLTVIFAFILAANSRDCVWLKNEEGAGKLTSLMSSPSGPAQFHFNKENKQAKDIKIHLSDGLDPSSNNMTMIIHIGNNTVFKSAWVNFDNLDLNVLLASSKDVDSANQTKYLSYDLKANISLHLKGMLLVYTSEGSFIFNLGLSGDQIAQNPRDALNLKPFKQKQGKFGPYLLQRQQTNLLHQLISVLIMASDLYFLQYYSKKTSFRLSRTASALYLFSEAIYFIEIFEAPSQKFQSMLITWIFMLAVIGKLLIFLSKIRDDFGKSFYREIFEDTIIMIIGLSYSYALYFLALVYCIIRDTQTSAQRKYNLDQRWLSHWRTFAIILYMPAFKLIYNIPNGFPFDSAIFWWSYFFMLIYLSSIWEISYRGGIKTCIDNAKQVLSAQLEVYRSILKNREVNNGKDFKMVEENREGKNEKTSKMVEENREVKNEKASKMAEENSQFEKIDRKKGKKKQMKQKSK